MQREDLNIIYDDFYNQLTYNDVVEKINNITTLLLNEIITNKTKYIFFDKNIYNSLDINTLLFKNIISKIFDMYPYICVVSPHMIDSKIYLIKLTKDTYYKIEYSEYRPIYSDIYNGEYFDLTIINCKYVDNNGYFESFYNEEYGLEKFSTVEVIGLCLFEPIYDIKRKYTNESRLSTLINSSGFIEFNGYPDNH